MLRIPALLALSMLLAASPMPFALTKVSLAQEETTLTAISDTTLLETLYNAPDSASAALFAPSFLAEVPFDQVQAILAATRETVGPTVVVTGSGQQFVATSETHTQAVTMIRDDLGRIAGLFLATPDAYARTIDDILAELDALAPDVAWLVTRNGETIAAQNADQPLAVGSAFKLGVLAALQDAITAGDVGWNEVFLLEEGYRSLPSGLLQGFAVDSPLTIATVAALMISQSDNTATDMVIDIVGRDAVADALGIAMPLTTREFFVLKANATLREQWLAIDPDDDAARADLLAALADAPLPTAGEVAIPHNQGVEWYVPLETLCEIVTTVADDDVFAINPGPVRAGDWQRVAYKGGSELGVLNLTAHLVDPDGVSYCAAITLNAPETLDQAGAVALYTALTARLAEGAFADGAEAAAEAEAED